MAGDGMPQAVASAESPIGGVRVAADEPAACHAIGRRARPIARSYARATGRIFRSDLCLDPRSTGGKDVIVALADDLTDELLEETTLSQNLSGSAPGFLVGRTPEELCAKANASAAWTRGTVSSLPFRLDLSPQLPIGVIETDDFALCGRTSDMHHLRTLLGRGESLVVVTGHGDGIDGDFGPLVLCPVDAAFAAEARPRKPTCRISGHCHRLGVIQGSSVFDERTLPPAAIRARAMVWNTCVGWSSHDGFIDRTYGAGLRLAASPALGALATTARIVIGAPVSADALAARLLRGMPIGEAVAAHNRSPQARASGHQFVLFGDPLLRIAPQLVEKGGERGKADPVPSPARPPTPSPHRPLAPPSPASAHPPDNSALTALAALASSRSELATRQCAFAALTRELAKGGIEGVWVRAGKVSRRGEVPCPHCASDSTRLSLAGSSIAGGRLLTICRRCEVAADTSPEPRLTAHVGAGAIWRLQGERPTAGHWLGSLVVRRCAPFDTVVQPWPADADGRPRSVVDCGQIGRAAPMTLAAMFHAHQQLSIFSRPLPAEAGETERQSSAMAASMNAPISGIEAIAR